MAYLVRLVIILGIISVNLLLFRKLEIPVERAVSLFMSSTDECRELVLDNLVNAKVLSPFFKIINHRL